MSAVVQVGPMRCECCEHRPATTRIVLPDGDQAVLCGSCTDDAVELGLVQLQPTGERP